jgi:hypothetical protein
VSRSTSARALILAKGIDSDGAGVLRIPDPAVLEELKISWASGEQEKPDWKEKGSEGEEEEQEGKEKLEQEPFHLLPEPKKEEPESEKEEARYGGRGARGRGEGARAGDR